MEMHHPNALLHLLWLLPVLVLLTWRASRLRRRRLGLLVADKHAEADASEGKRRFRSIALVLGAALLIVAAARPQWGTELVQRPVQARDVMVVLDCSRSMLAQDVAPSRLRHAKLLVRRLVSQSPGDRFGLVAFAGASFLECPLTQDRSGFLLFLDDVSTNTIPVGGTNVEEALKTALDGFEAAEGRHRAILLITDGDELTGDFQKQAQACSDAEVRVFAVGLGDPELGSFLQLDDNSFVLDENGERVRSRLNETALRDLAETTDGHYLRSTPVHDGLDQLQARIQALIPEGKAEQTVARPMERYQTPLLAALLLLLVRLGTPETRSVLTLCLALLAGTSTVRADQAAPTVPTAVTRADTALDRAYAWYNEGVRLQQEGDAEGSRRALNEATAFALGDDALTAAICQNLGALDHEKGREQMLAAAMAGQKDPPAELREAVDFYRRALKSGAGADATGGNLEQALLDLARYEAMQKRMQELKKEQEKARKDVEDAARKQQEAAADSSNGKKQQQASQQTQKAQQSVKDLADKLRQGGAEEAADMLQEQVGQHLDRARGSQESIKQSGSQSRRRGHQQDAAESLEKALAAMGQQDQQPGSEGEDPNSDGEGNEPQNAENNPQEGENGDDPNDPGDDPQNGDPDQQQASDPDENRPAGGNTGGEAAAGAGMDDDRDSLDKEQALRILEANQRRERDLKRLLKERMKHAAAAGKVERDW
jgi:Ca-activated chloride channel family protein